MKPKILVVDVETSPIEAWVWALFDQNIGLEQIKTEWSILSYAAKWYGKSGMIYDDRSGVGPDKVRDDKPLMHGLWGLLDEADIVVAQNGAKFDVKKINARLIEHKFGPYSPIRVVDTLLASKRYFGFTSNKLAWTGEHIAGVAKSDHRRYPGMELWKECLKDNPKAWAEMKRYNCRDVTACEKKYTRLRPWIENHPNLGVYSDERRPLCPKCGSDKVVSRGSAMSVKQQGQYKRFVCKNCGGWARGKVMQLPVEKRRSLLVPE